MCGGTWPLPQHRNHRPGLSPRVRGNRSDAAFVQLRARSIPACAGEPVRRKARHRTIAVYPRVCGGTVAETQTRGAVHGLSPRVRGNPRLHSQVYARRRSIPACAGEPFGQAFEKCVLAVYPRVCGGTSGFREGNEQIGGLSPRVRGNRSCGVASDAPDGSIPACAGEPRLEAYLISVSGVYPRVCGGTPPGIVRLDSAEGLSPRVRGNPNDLVFSHTGQRSIPACAGEPQLPCWRARRVGVYPRVCGGTCAVG